MERCPHCARPGRFPNVLAAEDPEERAALDEKYNRAIQEAATRNCEKEIRDFEAAASTSKAVITCWLLQVSRLVDTDKEIYATFYELRDTPLRLPTGGKWNIWRNAVDGALFPNYMEKIRFASLSLDGTGSSHYGDCSLVLRDNMIAHRTSVFEDNSILFILRRAITVEELADLPKGYRATWLERSRLCIAKIAKKLTPNTHSDEYARLLMKQGITSADDDFVEAHIWGLITRRTIEKVVVTQPRKKGRRAILKALGEKISQAGGALEII